MRRRVLLIIWNIFAIILILYGTEAVLFFSDPVHLALTQRSNPSEEPNTWGHRVTFNSLGFREREIPPKSPGIERIMLLGDSIAWGTGVAVQERLGNVLERELSHSAQVEVFTFAEQGFSTEKEAEIFERYVDQVKPDLVIVTFCINDPQRKTQDYSIEKSEFNRRNFWIKRVRLFFGEWELSRLGQVFEKAMYASAERLGYFPSWEDALERAYDPRLEEWKAFEDALGRIMIRTKAVTKSPPIFALLNQGSSQYGGTSYKNPDVTLKRMLHWYELAGEAAARHGYRVVDFKNEIVHELDGENLSVNAFDGHPSARLHEVYGKKLAQIIKDFDKL